MAHPGAYRSEKRRKELARLKKREEKRQKRLAKTTQRTQTDAAPEATDQPVAPETGDTA